MRALAAILGQLRVAASAAKGHAEQQRAWFRERQEYLDGALAWLRTL